MSQTIHADLQVLRNTLESRRRELMQRKQRVTLDLTHQEHTLAADLTEQATQLQNDETLQAIGAAADSELLEIEVALQRIASGEYGVCADCDQAIAPLRLASLPQAVTCSACAR